MKKYLIFIFAFIILSDLTFSGFLTEKVNIPNGIYCIEDISFIFENTIGIPLLFLMV